MTIKHIYDLPVKFSSGSAILNFCFDDEEKGKLLAEYIAAYKGIKEITSGSDSTRYEYMLPDSADCRLVIQLTGAKNLTAEYFRSMVYRFLRKQEGSSFKKLYIVLPYKAVLLLSLAEYGYALQAAVEGAIYAEYTFDKYKKDVKSVTMPEIYFKVFKQLNNEHRLKDATDVMKGVFFARDLANEPANVLTPAELAQRCKKALTARNVTVKVFDEKEIKRRKMGGLLAVGEGSDNKPRFIVAEYKCGKKNAPAAAIVGKGVCFDSGGISIKPAQNMGMMKADMAGAAAAAGILLAAREMKLPVNIYCIIPAAENMLSGSAMRPGDIVTTSSGTTIEVDNTDAEGRMILADALHYASGLNPRVIIDLATLTGASAVALGDFVSCSFTKDEELSKAIYESGLKTHERVWPMPMWDDYGSLLSSDVADVKNTGGKWGGAITAAKFLEKWVDDPYRWIHLDIAGPAMPQKMTVYNETYMSGTGVRLVIDFLQQYLKD